MTIDHAVPGGRIGRVRRDDHQSSIHAANRVETSGSASTIRALVKRALTDAQHGLTDDELLPIVTGMCVLIGHRPPDESSPRKRRGELVEDGEVEAMRGADDQIVRRRNSTGSSMIVWCIAEERTLEERGMLF